MAMPRSGPLQIITIIIVTNITPVSHVFITIIVIIIIIAAVHRLSLSHMFIHHEPGSLPWCVLMVGIDGSQ